MLWQWGQFLDHDIDLTEAAEPGEPFNIPIPGGDPYFDPEGTGTQVMSLNRSAYDHNTGKTPDNPRQQMNHITAFIDASMVYGSDSIRAKALRTLDGTGRLKTSQGRLLPFNTSGLPNAGGTGPELFLAGDVRANEQVGLTALHTLFMREHNRIARNLRRQFPPVNWRPNLRTSPGTSSRPHSGHYLQGVSPRPFRTQSPYTLHGVRSWNEPGNQ